MRREAVTSRPNWQHKVEELGFNFYSLDGKAYWTEQACYAYSPAEVDEMEAAT
jgi:glutathionylspermidine synthase